MMNWKARTKQEDFDPKWQLKETQCKIKDGELNAFADVHYYKANLPSEVYRVQISALNVPPMGLFYPSILIPEEYPPLPHPWFHDYEDMLEDGSHTEFVKRSDEPDLFLSGYNFGLAIPESSESYLQKFRNEDNLVGLAQAITNSILSTGCLDVQKKLFTSIQLVGGVALTGRSVDTEKENLQKAIQNLQQENEDLQRKIADMEKKTKRQAQRLDGIDLLVEAAKEI